MSTGLWITCGILAVMIIASIIGYALTRAADDTETEEDQR
jgi:hypothetical protein